MKLEQMISVAVCLSLLCLTGLAGCAQQREQKEYIGMVDRTYTYKGLLVEVDHDRFSNNWVMLHFEGGTQAQLRVPNRCQLHIGHYQEITVNHLGYYISNKCDSYDDLADRLENELFFEWLAYERELTPEEPEELVATTEVADE